MAAGGVSLMEGAKRKMLALPAKEELWGFDDVPRRHSRGYEGKIISGLLARPDFPSGPLELGLRQPIRALQSDLHPDSNSDSSPEPEQEQEPWPGAWGIKSRRLDLPEPPPTSNNFIENARYDKMSVILCTAGYDHTIRFWEALSGICSRTIQHPESQVNRLCITPNKRYLAAAGRHAVRLYDVNSTNPNPVMTFEGHTGNIMAVAFHCDGKWMVTASEDGTVKVWDTRSGAAQRNYPHSHAVNDVVIHPNQGELISADRGGTVRIWDLGVNTCSHQLIPEVGVPMSTVSVASDGSLLAAGNNNGDVYLWRMYQHNDSTGLLPCRSFKAHSLHLTRLLISPDVKTLATCSADHSAKIWKIEPGEEFLEEVPKDAAAKDPTRNTGGSSSTLGGALSDSSKDSGPLSFGRIIHGSGSDEDYVPNGLSISNNVRHFPVGKPLPLEVTLDGHQRWVWDCAFSADSAYLVTVSSDHYARLWELSTGTVIRQYNGHHRGAVCVALNDYSEPR